MFLFFYKILEKINSPINGQITVYTSFGSPKVTIGGLLQSGGIVGDIWKKATKKISNPLISNILIFGLGCGTAAQVFSKKFPKAKIIGVEIDPLVILMGKKYFGLDKIPNLKIVAADALKYTSYVKFNLIIVDIYLGEKIPPIAESLLFLKNLKNLLAKNGIVIFNRIFWDEHKKEAENFVKKAERVFSKLELIRTVANLLVICR